MEEFKSISLWHTLFDSTIGRGSDPCGFFYLIDLNHLRKTPLIDKSKIEEELKELEVPNPIEGGKSNPNFRVEWDNTLKIENLFHSINTPQRTGIYCDREILDHYDLDPKKYAIISSGNIGNAYVRHGLQMAFDVWAQAINLSNGEYF